MKQAEVLFEELENGNIKIIEFKNVAKLDEIKYDEYRKMYPSMWVERSGYFRINVTPREAYHYGVEQVETITSKSDFNELIKIMKQCGENYAKAKNAAMSKKRVIKSIKI
jgi:hypothetical protein